VGTALLRILGAEWVTVTGVLNFNSMIYHCILRQNDSERGDSLSAYIINYTFHGMCVKVLYYSNIRITRGRSNF